MAWLQGLAGKAEGLLNRMDQTAAVSLHSGSSDHLNQQALSSETSGGQDTWNSLHRLRRSGSNSSTVSDFTDGTGRYHGQASVIDETTEDLLQGSMRRTASHQDFEWTNASPKPKPQRNSSAKTNPDYFAEINSIAIVEPNERMSAKRASPVVSNDERIGELDETNISVQKTELTSQASSGGTEAIVRENQLMKSELQGQSRELSMALSRVKRAEQDAQKLLNQLSAERQKFAAENDTRERDFLTALSAKDVQTVAMRSTLDQVEKAWKTAETNLLEAKMQLKKFDQLTSSHSLRDIEQEESARRLAEVESLLQKEKEHAAGQIDRLKVTIKLLEDQSRDYISSVASLERLRASDHSSLEDFRRQANLLSAECEVAQRELAEYKQKALKILQSKDELINSLKSENGVVNDELANLEASEIEQERDLLRDEVVKLRETTDKATQQLHRRDTEYKRNCADLQEQLLQAEQAVLAETDRCREIEATIKSYTDEVNYIRSEASRKEQSLQQRLKDRDEDLQRMRQQLLTRSESRPVDGELESRMRMLTENLIQKQSSIETLNTEKHAMSVQIERLEKRLREASRSSGSSAFQESRITMSADSTDQSANGRAPSFLTEKATDNKVARHLKSAYSTVDRFSFRLAIFLRRYPLARVMVIAYMLLLHFWVLVVLLTYTPEIHGHESAGKK